MSDRYKLLLSSALALCMAAPTLPVFAQDNQEENAANDASVLLGKTTKTGESDPVVNETVGQTEDIPEAGDTQTTTIIVTFDANGGKWSDGESFKTSSKTIPVGSASYFDLPSAPAKEGYTFKGWNTKVDGSGTAFTDTTAAMVSTTVFAQWRKNVSGEGEWEKQPDGQYKYILPNGNYAGHGPLEIKGKTYFFNAEGIMVTGFVQWDGKIYYFDQSGAMKTGWLKDANDDWYYCTKDGVKIGWFLDAGNWYYFYANGKMATTWVKDGNDWYYCDHSGAMIENRWATIKGYQYYFTSSGAMKTGWYKDPNDQKYYLLSDTGAMCTGWYQDPKTKEWYLLGKDGAMVTGWYTDPETNRTYLLNDDGTMVTGWCHNTHTDEWYYFNIQSGYQVKSSWVRSEGKYFYIKADGVMARSSWIRSKKGDSYVYYYVQADGTMAQNTTIGQYHFNESGVCTNPGRD